MAESGQYLLLETHPHLSLPSFYISVVYGANDLSSRRQLREDLLCSQPTRPWIIAGDFNCIRNDAEKRGSTYRNASAMSDFNSFIDGAALIEMPTIGSTFTWSNMHHTNPTLSRLDRTLCTHSCLTSFTQCSAHVAPKLLSDHCPILITLSMDRGCANGGFKFFNHWPTHPSFLPLVARF